MSKKWTHTAAFEQFGTEPKNVQWSWSARNEVTKTVVATLWQDQFERRDGKVTYKRPGAIAGERRSPGLSELIENFTWARDNCDGLFNVIIAIAKDKAADPRSIQECFPSKMIMKLINFDEETGAFMAEAQGI